MYCLTAGVLANPRLEIYPAGRADIAAGAIAPRILALLQLASRRHTLTVSSLQSGHSRCVNGASSPNCRISYHWYGRAVDISAVDHPPVSPTNTAARNLARWLHDLPAHLRPDETGTPWSELTHLPGYFTDPHHQDHLHIGLRRARQYLPRR